jgi:hypothetical protein
MVDYKQLASRRERERERESQRERGREREREDSRNAASMRGGEGEGEGEGKGEGQAGVASSRAVPPEEEVGRGEEGRGGHEASQPGQLVKLIRRLHGNVPQDNGGDLGATAVTAEAGAASEVTQPGVAEAGERRVYAGWERGVGGAGKGDKGLKESECDTGGWKLVHRGEVEVEMPAAVASKLTVLGRKARVHRIGAKQLYDKLGFEGTVKRSTLKLAGCPKVYSSRTEMLRELNTTGLPTYESARRDRLKRLKTQRHRRPWSAAPADASERGEGMGAAERSEGVAVAVDLLDRFKAWEAKRKAKVEALKAQKEANEEARMQEGLKSESQAVGGGGLRLRSVLDRRSPLTSRETDALLTRMQVREQQRRGTERKKERERERERCA